MFFLTGDIHGNSKELSYKIIDMKSRGIMSANDTLIILGDVGLNYNGADSKDDIFRKEVLSNCGMTIFCIHGNHEMRPESVGTYTETEWCGGTVFVEHNYPNLLFAKDGEIYDFDGKKAIVIGGAYSVDKHYRLLRGLSWFADEQPSAESKERVEQNLTDLEWSVDYVLSHTCPAKYIPTEAFLPFIDQSTVDNSTEEWLDRIEDRLNYKKWFCGHWHIDKTIAKMRFMFNDFDTLNNEVSRNV